MRIGGTVTGAAGFSGVALSPINLAILFLDQVGSCVSFKYHHQLSLLASRCLACLLSVCAARHSRHLSSGARVGFEDAAAVHQPLESGHYF